MQRDPAHPFTLAGIVTLGVEDDAFIAQTHDLPPSLGPVRELEAILVSQAADLLIITRTDIPRANISQIVETCERAYVEWKVIPGNFDIFLSGLRLQTIGHIPVLGVEELPIERLFSRALKRTLDMVGAIVGLGLATPVMLLAAAFIKRESPDGPILFRQTRIGSGHRPFTVYKLRSMLPDAAFTDTARQSTERDDPRLLEPRRVTPILERLAWRHEPRRPSPRTPLPRRPPRRSHPSLPPAPPRETRHDWLGSSQRPARRQRPRRPRATRYLLH